MMAKTLRKESGGRARQASRGKSCDLCRRNRRGERALRKGDVRERKKVKGSLKQKYIMNRRSPRISFSSGSMGGKRWSRSPP